MTSMPAVASTGSRGPQQVAQVLDVGQASGEEIIRAFFFLGGPVVKLFPELKSAREEAVARGYRPDTAVERAVLADVHRTDPTFLGRFAAAMTSGDHIKVEAALTEAARLVVASTERVLEKNLSGDGPSAQSITATVAVVAVMGAAVAAWLVAGGTVFVVADVAFWDGTLGDGNVSQDRVVALVASRLAA
jgi:SdpC family antimicrobial peptide